MFLMHEKGHTPNWCNIKHCGVPTKKYAWEPIIK